MRELEVVGNLKIPCPANEDALQVLLAAQDGSKVGRIDAGEWKNFLKANVVTPSGSQAATLKKLAVSMEELHRVVGDLATAQRALAETVARQQDDLRRLLPGAGGGGDVSC